MGYKAEHAWDQGKMIGSFGSAAGILGIDRNYVASVGDVYFNTNLNELREHDGTYWRPIDSSPSSTIQLFEQMPILMGPNGGVAADTDNTINLWHIGRETFEVQNEQTQTLFYPGWSASGLQIGMDQTQNDGFEITQGITANSKHCYTIGTDAFYMKCTLNVADPTDPLYLHAGFRKVQAYQAAIGTYTDVAAIGCKNDLIQIFTTLNNAADADTDTTDAWVTVTDYVLEIRVSAAGVVTFTVDGSEPTTTKAFTFDSGDTVVPFLLHLENATTGAIYIKRWEVGLQ